MTLVIPQQPTAFHRPIVAIYCRISFDRHGRAEGVEAQERWGRAYAAKHWPNYAVEIFPDNNIGATDPTVERPEFDRLCEWIRDRRVAHVWSVEQSRLTRDEIEWFKLAAILDEADLSEVHTDRDGIVRVRDDVAGIKAVLAAGEIRRLKRRLRDKFSDEAMRGIAPTVRCFGYKTGMTPSGERTYIQVPEEADAIRWAADAFLSGWNDQMIAAEWRKRGLAGAHRLKVRDPETGTILLDDEGLPQRHASVVTGKTVRRALTNPAVAGLRSYHGEIVANGIWEAIIPEETRQEILTKIGSVREVHASDGSVFIVDPAVTQRRARTRRKYLLTGGVATAPCGSPLAASERKFRTGSGPYYFCKADRCVGIAAGPFETYVKDMMFKQLAKPEFLDRFSADPAGPERERLTTQLKTIAEKREDLAAAWASNDGMQMDEWQQARAGLDRREQALHMQLMQLPPRPPQRFDPEAIKDPRAWQFLNLGERCEYISMFVQEVKVLKAVPPFRHIDLPARVKITFK